MPLPKMPQPDVILKDDRQFNAVKRPGNTFTIGKVPDDFELSSLSFTPDGKALFIGWASGRFEEREISSDRKILEFKTGETPVYDVIPAPTHHLMLINTSGRTIRFVDDSTGKQQRVVKEKAGKYKYDIQTIIVGPEAKWLAYATEDSGESSALTTERRSRTLAWLTISSCRETGKRCGHSTATKYAS